MESFVVTGGNAEPDHTSPETTAIANGGQTFGGDPAESHDATPPPPPRWADGKGLPTYYRSECPLCSQKPPRGTCHGCGQSLDTIPDQSVRGVGYQSQTWDHWHFKQIDRLDAREPVTATLCLECYRADFARAYPSEPCPV